ncbi:MAG TPA: flavodoxin domain-containing protein [Bacillota bacterium]|nr:flavodoxin domain-containing protein [Bacillota bacterium]
MEKAIIYYSKTGNTENIVKRMSSFKALKVVPENDNPNIQNPVIVDSPEVKGYQEIIFASPVHGFQLAIVMRKYLESLDDLNGKTSDIFVTHHFPFVWMGGNSTLKQMKTIIESKNGQVRHMTSINWTSKKREKCITDMIAQYQD